MRRASGFPLAFQANLRRILGASCQYLWTDTPAWIASTGELLNLLILTEPIGRLVRLNNVGSEGDTHLVSALLALSPWACCLRSLA
jgi:hypothetical protein